MPDTASISLPPRPASVGTARRFLAETLRSWNLPDLEFAATQALTEIATNAVIHAQSQFAVVVNWAQDVLKVCVEDRSPRLPVQRSYSIEATTGRGLAMVARLCRAWGVDTNERGKSVWFEVVPGADVLDDAESDVDVDALLARYDDDSTADPGVRATGATSLDRAA